MNFDLMKIPSLDFPMIVFSDNTDGFIEFLIKMRTQGTFNHVMWALASDQFASQGNTYKIVPFSAYSHKTDRLRFVQVKVDDVCKAAIVASINRRLSLPWYKKLYDWVGIFGQAIGIKSLNINGLNYCEEDVALHLTACVDLIIDPHVKEVISITPLHASPEDLLEFFNQNPDIFINYAEWDGE